MNSNDDTHPCQCAGRAPESKIARHNGCNTRETSMPVYGGRDDTIVHPTYTSTMNYVAGDALAIVASFLPSCKEQASLLRTCRSINTVQNCHEFTGT